VRLARGKKGVSMTSKRLQPGEGIAGWVIQSGKSLIVEDIKENVWFSDWILNGLDMQFNYHFEIDEPRAGLTLSQRLRNTKSGSFSISIKLHLSYTNCIIQVKIGFMEATCFDIF
jgi:hypothetical protein